MTAPITRASAITHSDETVVVAADSEAKDIARAATRRPIEVLTRIQALGAFAAFVGWLALFAGGILVDTKPYRTSISASGVTALERPETGAAAANASGAAVPESAGARPVSNKFFAWFVVLTCFLPINLAWVCAAASLLGGYGNRANLSDDDAARRFRDTTNPFVSALLRGFFVYLFMTSGLLLLDDSPFSNPAPGQYIRLAGFLSLFSFVVSYQPRLFNVLIVWAFHRIQVREGEDPTAKPGISFHQKKTTSEEVSVTKPAAEPPKS